MRAAAARVLVGAALAAALGAQEPPEPQIERLTGSPAIFSIKGFASPAECAAPPAACHPIAPLSVGRPC